MSGEEPRELAAAGEAEGSDGALTPDAIFLRGEGEEGLRVNGDEAYPPLDRVHPIGGRRWNRGGRARGGQGQYAGKERGERDRNR